jgi:hypothetical protein
MKRLIVAAAAAAALAGAAPGLAMAQTGNTGAYATLGYDNTHQDGFDLGQIQGRLGWRFGDYLGVEGELSGGVKSDHTTVGGSSFTQRIQHQEAIYGVGFLPINPSLDLLGRVGYGNTSTKSDTAGNGSSGVSLTHGGSWNYGAGAQYRFDGSNGVRFDYTREEFTGSSGSGHADVLALAYTHRF